jgi:predicted dehydrogenase
VTLAALQAGKHVLCEKPLATTVADGEAMVAAARDAGRLLALNMHNRVRADMQVLRALTTEGRLGKIGYTSVRWFRRSGIPGFGSWFTRRDMSGGGVLMDIGVHMLDLALWLLGFPQVVAVRGETQAIHGPRGRGMGGWGIERVPGGTFDVEDLAATHLRLADGGLVTVEVSWAIHGRDELRVQLFGDTAGADASNEVYGLAAPLRIYKDEGNTPVEMIPTLPRLAGSEWDRSMARFVEAIRTGAEPTATGEEALTVLRLLDATYRSASEGREITV